jgi:glycosyltransferase involved in cell wall biosynthesis
MPVYNQSGFLFRSISSLCNQSYKNWELLIIDDGSTDKIKEALPVFLSDPRIRLLTHSKNLGLGAALNNGLANANSELISYLPADDIYYINHLESLVKKIESVASDLIYSLRYENNFMSEIKNEELYLHLVQVLHKNNNFRWVERKDLVTDDLHKMFWNNFGLRKTFDTTSEVTCERVEHPLQRHSLIKETLGGGINPYRKYYNVSTPLNFQSSVGNSYDENSLYKNFRQKNEKNGKKILIVGELAFNPERIYALEEKGYELFGLWMPNPKWYSYVGPLPFGNISDLNYATWQAEIKEIKPDVIYALLNSYAIPFIKSVISEPEVSTIPIVWHIKESPLHALADGYWEDFLFIFHKAKKVIVTSPEVKLWLRTLLGTKLVEKISVIDGDLPSIKWFTDNFAEKLSLQDKEPHTVIAGRPMGLYPEHIGELAQEHVHFHFYGEVIQTSWKNWVKKSQDLAGKYFHIHQSVSQDKWVSELSKYDAGWLHYFESSNNGEIFRFQWNDMNYPARIGLYMCAGIPLLQKDNTGHTVSTQILSKKNNIGLTFNSMADLAGKLRDIPNMTKIKKSIIDHRKKFTFDYYVDELTSLFF